MDKFLSIASFVYTYYYMENLKAKSDLLTTNPNLIIVNQGMMIPSKEIMNKTISYDCQSKVSFLLKNIDSILRLLSFCSGHFFTVNQILKNFDEEYTKEEILQLATCNILVRNNNNKINYNNFLSRYQESVFDYPFQNYFYDKWQDYDAKLMQFYKTINETPALKQKLRGKTFNLPTVNKPYEYKKDINKDEITLENIATLLKFTFAPVNVISGKNKHFYQKTSPSGGAKHPTEGYLVVKKHSKIPMGIYSYDIEFRQLVECNNKFSLFDFSTMNTDVAIIITSKVERAMWRYRDIRAFRPLLVDAGHIIETIRLLLNSIDIPATILPPFYIFNDILEHKKEPLLAYIEIGNRDNSNKEYNYQKIEYKSEENDFSLENLEINPLSIYFFEDKKFKAQIFYPNLKTITLNEEMEYAIRYFSVPKKERKSSLSNKLIENILPEMIGSKVLISISECTYIKSNIKLWKEHNWYLSLLANLEVTNFLYKKNRQFKTEKTHKLFNSTVLLENLLNRRSTRRFKFSGIKKEILINILSSTFDSFYSCDLPTNIRVHVAIYNKKKNAADVYQWDVNTKKNISIQKTISSEKIRFLTIGQSWAGQSDFTIWLSKSVDIKNASHYEFDIIELGRLGQRICLLATDNHLGVCQTPAVVDKELCELLNLENPKNQIIYTFSIGTHG